MSIVFGASIYLGPATPRQYSVVLMSAFLMCNRSKLMLRYNNLLVLYSIFLFFYGVSCFVENRFSDYIRELIAYYAVAIICFFSTILYYRKYNNFEAPLKILYLSGLLNTLVNGLQYVNHPIGMALGILFVNQDNGQKLSMFSHLSDGDTGSMLFGLLGDPVLNGYFSMLIPLLALYMIKKTTGLTKIFNWLSFFVTLVMLFLIQQRGPFVIALLLSIFIVMRKYNIRKYFFVISFIVTISLLFVLPVILESSIFTNSRFASDEEDSRSLLYAEAISFVLSNPIYGGVNGYISYSHNMPHNVIFNAFIYSGIIGGICILKMLYEQSKIVFRNIKKNETIFVTLLFSAYTLNGLVHNPSLVTGDALLWILWGMTFTSAMFHRSSQTQ